MSRVQTQTEIVVRAWHDDDLPHVLELLQAALGGGPAGVRPAEFFRWKHLENPFGRSFMLVAEADGRLDRPPGVHALAVPGRERTFTPCARSTRRPIRTTKAGECSRCSRGARSRSMRGEVDLVFNTPNEKSLPGYLKMGWRVRGTCARSWSDLSIRFDSCVSDRRSTDRPNRRLGDPVDAENGGRCARRARPDRSPARSGNRLRSEVRAPIGAELPQVAVRGPLRCSTIGRSETSGRAGLRGLAVFRVRPRGRLWESTVAEVIVEAGDGATRRPPVPRRPARSEGRPRHGIVPAWIDQFTFGAPTGFRPGARGADHGRQPFREGIHPNHDPFVVGRRPRRSRGLLMLGWCDPRRGSRVAIVAAGWWPRCCSLPPYPSRCELGSYDIGAQRSSCPSSWP